MTMVGTGVDVARSRHDTGQRLAKSFEFDGDAAQRSAR